MSGDRAGMRRGLIALYGFIGVVHLAATDTFLPIMPDWVPAPRLVVIVTGLCEIAGALALTTRRWRRLAGLMLALYAVCVFPANVKQAVEHIAVPPIPDTWWYHGPRLALQPVLVWWALYAVHIVNWPFRVSKGIVPFVGSGAKPRRSSSGRASDSCRHPPKG